MVRNKRRHTTLYTPGLVAAALVIGLLLGAILTFIIVVPEITQLQGQVSSLRDEISQIRPGDITYIIRDNTSLSELYEDTKDSVVVIRGAVSENTVFGTQTGQVQGSGFVYEYEGQMVVVTNFHVVNDATDITVTFSDGKTYSATVLGTDPYADLAVVSTEAPESELKPLKIVSSSTLEVGDPVVAIGTPFGLTGSLTVGIVSQIGRTINESTIGAFSIANIIQTSAAINPGNSGGPLLNYMGEVVGITTAIISDSQGLGFAIPSNLILREIGSLIETGTYTQHSWLGVVGADMDYEIARAMGTDVTYGWLITYVLDGGPADRAGLRAGTEEFERSDGTTILIGGDILVGIGGTPVVNGDEFLTYLAEYTLPNQTVDLLVVRGDQTITVPIVLGERPPPP